MLIRVFPAINDEHARERLGELVAERREDYTGLSRLIGRPAGYLARYVRAGTPRRLPGQEVATLARYFGVEACELGYGL